MTAVQAVGTVRWVQLLRRRAPTAACTRITEAEGTCQTDPWLTVLLRRLRDNSGQDLLEYALLGAFVSLTAMAAANYLGGSLDNWLATVGESLAEKEKQSNCSPTGMAASMGKCNGG